MHKSDLDPKYHYLASSSLPYTEFLYGEDCDVNKNVREINDLNRIGRSLAKPFPAGRGSYSYRGQRFPRRSRGRGRWMACTDAMSSATSMQQNTPKNWRGGHKK